MPKRGIVMMGQSNGIAGYAEDRVDAFRSHPNLWQYKQDKTFEQAPITPLDFAGISGRKFTAYSWYLVRDYLIPRNPGVDFCILPQSVGGTGFTDYWHAPNPALTTAVGVDASWNQYPLGGAYYEKTIEQINAFLAAEVGNTIDLVILQNGEQETAHVSMVGWPGGIGYYHDSFGLTNKQAYTRYVTEMIADMAARVTGGRTWPFLIGSVPPDLTYPQTLIGPSADGLDHSGSQYIPIFEAQKEMPGFVSNCGYIDCLYPTKALYHDGIKTQGSDTTTGDAGTNGADGQPDIIVNSTQYYIHYSQAAFRLIAHRAFKQYMKLKGYGTPITLTYVAPVVVVPEAPSLDLAAGSDTGTSSTDNITTDTTPDIIVTFVTSVLEHDIIRLRDGVTELVAHEITAAEIGSLSLALGLSPLAGGAHSLTARHERGTGLSPYSAVLTFTVDVTGPTITTASTANVNEGALLAVSLTASEAVTWTETLDAGNNFEISGTTLRWTGNGTKTFTGVVDAYTCEVTATDAAGNATAKSITVTVVDVVTDTTPPTITTPATANVNEGVALAIALTADEAVTWSLFSGGADFEISGTTLRWLGNGTKTFTGVVDAYAAVVTATDGASNATNKTITVTVLDVVAGTTRSFGAEGAGITVTIGGREFGAEGLGIVES